MESRPIEENFRQRDPEAGNEQAGMHHGDVMK